MIRVCRAGLPLAVLVLRGGVVDFVGAIALGACGWVRVPPGPSSPPPGPLALAQCLARSLRAFNREQGSYFDTVNHTCDFLFTESGPSAIRELPFSLTSCWPALLL